MSVSVNDLLKLPSLRQAKVVAGKNVLHKRVTSISVLESANPSLLVDNVFEQGEYFGSEIAITGFLDCTDDIDLQCASIRRLSEGGEIGLIIFYVGVYLPRIDKKLIDLANSLDFVLIQMPKSKDLRYAEVISDVTECLHLWVRLLLMCEYPVTQIQIIKERTSTEVRVALFFSIYECPTQQDPHLTICFS